MMKNSKVSSKHRHNYNDVPYNYLHSNRIPEAHFCHLGGKALGLLELEKLRLNIPKWSVITTGFFQEQRANSSELTQCLNQASDFFENHFKKASSHDLNKISFEKSHEIRAIIKGFEFKNDYLTLLSTWYGEISKQSKHPLAVRSSATDEDQEGLSFAGQMDSILNVRTETAFLQAIRDVWASLYNDHAVSYRLRHGMNPWKAEIAIIIQQMIPGSVSGVLFTANTITGNSDQMLVNSVWGLGEGLVSGELDADVFVLDANGHIHESKLAHKAYSIVYNESGGTSRSSVSKEKHDISCLSVKELKNLHKIGLKIQTMKNSPMDIEFTLYKNKLYILQARPITTFQPFNTTTVEPILVWDNSNIVESYSGVTTPLTFTFIKTVYTSVYKQFCEILHVPEKIIKSNEYLYQNMLGLLFGRVYYNLINWYKLVALLPGFQYNRGFFEQMMGLQVIKEYIKPEAPLKGFKKYFVQLPQLIRMGFRMIWVLLNLRKRIAKFFDCFYTTYNTYRSKDFNTMSACSLLELRKDLECKILNNWKEPILNDLKAMIFYGVLKKLTINWDVDDQGNFQNELMAGEGEIKSKLVVTELFSIAQSIESIKDGKDLFSHATPEDALAMLLNDHRFQQVRHQWEAYLYEYGVRTMEEMKLESIPIKDNPLFCIAVIQNYLKSKVPDPEDQQAKERKIREDAERIVRKRLKGKRLFYILSKYKLYNWVLKHARHAIQDRENQRFCRTEIYSIVRDMFRAIGKQWTAVNLLDAIDDIFYLEWDEIWGYVEGTCTMMNLKELVQVRKQEFESYVAINPPDHIETKGTVLQDVQKWTSIDEQVVSSVKLHGLGCSPGIVEGNVCVLEKPDIHINLQGEILVAKQTDPGWVLLFPSISGLIVEKGSMLSHSAIVSREMAIPAVVGVKNATRLLSSGMNVRLNGATGSIEILES